MVHSQRNRSAQAPTTAFSEILPISKNKDIQHARREDVGRKSDSIV